MQKSCKYEVGLDVSEARSAIANELFIHMAVSRLFGFLDLFGGCLGIIWGLFEGYVGLSGVRFGMEGVIRNSLGIRQNIIGILQNFNDDRVKPSGPLNKRHTAIYRWRLLLALR